MDKYIKNIKTAARAINGEGREMENVINEITDCVESEDNYNNLQRIILLAREIKKKQSADPNYEQVAEYTSAYSGESY